MDLFVINRYTGEDESSFKKDEEKKLSKVLKNAEKRKKIRLQRKIKAAGKLKQTVTEISPLPRDETKQKDDGPTVKLKERIVTDENKDTNQNDNANSKPIDTTSFTILGTDKFTEKREVKRVLPAWLSDPGSVIHNNSNPASLTDIHEMSRVSQNFNDQLIKVGITKYFPIQRDALNYILQRNFLKNYGTAPCDLCISAPTGSGKTLCYVIPVLQAIKNKKEGIKALIMLPTQNLAVQVYEVFKYYAEGLDLNITLITGSNSMAKDRLQLIKCDKGIFSSKANVVVGTPGRLVEHLKCTQGFNLGDLEYLVIDEADRVLDNIQDDWLMHLESHLTQVDKDHALYNYNNDIPMEPRKLKLRPQRILLSATLTQDPEKLQKLNLYQPVLFTCIFDKSDSDTEQTYDKTKFIGKFTTPLELTEKYILTNSEMKPLVLHKYISSNKLTKVLVFTNTIDSVHRLRLLLKTLAPDMNVQEISSKLTLNRKKRLMKAFSSGSIDILVCTDSIARGIDFPNVQAVISYAAPTYLKTYIHRVGRTARAGIEGLAVTLVEHQQEDHFLKMVKEANKKLKKEEVKFLEEDDNGPNDSDLLEKYKQALDNLKVQLAAEEEHAKMQMMKEKGLAKRKFKRPNRKDAKKNKIEEEPTKQDNSEAN